MLCFAFLLHCQVLARVSAIPAVQQWEKTMGALLADGAAAADEKIPQAVADHLRTAAACDDRSV